MRSAIQGGKVTTEYPSLNKFLIESAIYEQVGLNFEDLKNRPLQEVVDYVTIVNLITNEKARQQAKAEAQANNGKARY